MFGGFIRNLIKGLTAHSRLALSSFFVSIVLISFQNCSSPQPLIAKKDTKISTPDGTTSDGTTLAGNGEGYDGKTRRWIKYAKDGECTDSSIRKEIIQDESGSFFLTVDNCQKISKRLLLANDIDILPHNDDFLIFADEGFIDVGLPMPPFLGNEGGSRLSGRGTCRGSFVDPIDGNKRTVIDFNWNRIAENDNVDDYLVSLDIAAYKSDDSLIFEDHIAEMTPDSEQVHELGHGLFVGQLGQPGSYSAEIMLGLEARSMEAMVIYVRGMGFGEHYMGNAKCYQY